jgi:predicted GNAT family N-acyltransferase
VSKPERYHVRQADWNEDREALRAIRHAVFVVEQRVAQEEEWDGLDQHALHILALDPRDRPLGCGRLLQDGRIGRMAVLREWRGQGVGGALLSALMELARRQGSQNVHLHAQTHAVPFYERHGFTKHGAEFVEANIAHWAMTREL